MKITKQFIKSLTWPTGATHLKVETPAGKHAIADRKSAPVSLDGIEGTLTFGAMVKKSPKDKAGVFTPLSNGAVKEEALPAPAATVAATTTSTVKQPKAKKAEKPAKQPKVKAEKAPKGPTTAELVDINIMRRLHAGDAAGAMKVCTDSGLDATAATLRFKRVEFWWKRAAKAIAAETGKPRG